MIPAQQCFKSGNPVFREIDDGLVEYLELFCGNGIAKIKLKSAPGLGLDVHLGFEEVEPASSFFLGTIQCHVGILQKLIRTVTVIGRNRNPNAGANDDTMIAEFEWQAQGFDDA